MFNGILICCEPKFVGLNLTRCCFSRHFNNFLSFEFVQRSNLTQNNQRVVLNRRMDGTWN